MRHTYDLQDRFTRCTVSVPPPFGHLLTEPGSSVSRGAANANVAATGDASGNRNDDDASDDANANASTSGDEIDIDLDTDLDVDMDIQSDDSSSADSPPGTDAVRTDRRAWSRVPRVATPASSPAAPEAPACPLRDRRSSYRHGVSLPVELQLLGPSGAERHVAQTRMLSFGGAFIESSLRPAFASRVALSFEVPGHDLSIEVIGVVRWSDARGFGVQFGGLRAHAIWALGKFFSNL